MTISEQEAAAPSEEPVAWQETPPDIVQAARVAADTVGVTPYSVMRVHVEHAVRYALLVERASPAVAPVASVMTKPLGWRANLLMNWVAPSIVGQYFVFKDAGDSTWAMAVPDAVAAGEFKTADLAKAAAQADFNARILSSIIPATKGGEAELVARINGLIESTYEDDGDGNGIYETPLTVLLRDVRAALAALSAQDTDGVAKPVTWQWLHYDPISGDPAWHNEQSRNGHTSTFSRPLYTDIPPDSYATMWERQAKTIGELQNEIDRLKKGPSLNDRAAVLTENFDQDHNITSEEAAEFRAKGEGL